MTSDDVVVPGIRYVLEIRCEGQPTDELHLSSNTMTTLMLAWRRLEHQEGRRLEMAEMTMMVMEAYLDRTPTTAVSSATARAEAHGALGQGSTEARTRRD